MPQRPKLKKSESLEIRIPFPIKEAFMARCREDGRTASETLRDLIDRDLAGRASFRKRGARRWFVGAAVASAVAAVALPTLAKPSPKAEFERLDANRDGQLSLSEYSAKAGPLSRIALPVALP